MQDLTKLLQYKKQEKRDTEQLIPGEEIRGGRNMVRKEIGTLQECLENNLLETYYFNYTKGKVLAALDSL